MGLENFYMDDVITLQSQHQETMKNGAIMMKPLFNVIPSTHCRFEASLQFGHVIINAKKVPCYKRIDDEWRVPITLLRETCFPGIKIIDLKKFTEALNHMSLHEVGTMKKWLTRSSIQGDLYTSLNQADMACTVKNIEKHYESLLELFLKTSNLQENLLDVNVETSTPSTNGTFKLTQDDKHNTAASSAARTESFANLEAKATETASLKLSVNASKHATQQELKRISDIVMTNSLDSVADYKEPAHCALSMNGNAAGLESTEQSDASYVAKTTCGNTLVIDKLETNTSTPYTHNDSTRCNKNNQTQTEASTTTHKENKNVAITSPAIFKKIFNSSVDASLSCNNSSNNVELSSKVPAGYQDDVTRDNFKINNSSPQNGTHNHHKTKISLPSISNPKNSRNFSTILSTTQQQTKSFSRNIFDTFSNTKNPSEGSCQYEPIQNETSLTVVNCLNLYDNETSVDVTKSNVAHLSTNTHSTNSCQGKEKKKLLIEHNEICNGGDRVTNEMKAQILNPTENALENENFKEMQNVNSHHDVRFIHKLHRASNQNGTRICDENTEQCDSTILRRLHPSSSNNNHKSFCKFNVSNGSKFSNSFDKDSLQSNPKISEVKPLNRFTARKGAICKQPQSIFHGTRGGAKSENLKGDFLSHCNRHKPFGIGNYYYKSRSIPSKTRCRMVSTNNPPADTLDSDVSSRENVSEKSSLSKLASDMRLRTRSKSTTYKTTRKYVKVNKKIRKNEKNNIHRSEISTLARSIPENPSVGVDVKATPNESCSKITSSYLQKNFEPSSNDIKLLQHISSEKSKYEKDVLSHETTSFDVKQKKATNLPVITNGEEVKQSIFVEKQEYSRKSNAPRDVGCFSLAKSTNNDDNCSKILGIDDSLETKDSCFQTWFFSSPPSTWNEVFFDLDINIPACDSLHYDTGVSFLHATGSNVAHSDSMSKQNSPIIEEANVLLDREQRQEHFSKLDDLSTKSALQCYKIGSFPVKKNKKSLSSFEFVNKNSEKFSYPKPMKKMMLEKVKHQEINKNRTQSRTETLLSSDIDRIGFLFTTDDKRLDNPIPGDTSKTVNNFDEIFSFVENKNKDEINCMKTTTLVIDEQQRLDVPLTIDATPLCVKNSDTGNRNTNEEEKVEIISDVIHCTPNHLQDPERSEVHCNIDAQNLQKNTSQPINQTIPSATNSAPSQCNQEIENQHPTLHNGCNIVANPSDERKNMTPADIFRKRDYTTLSTSDPLVPNGGKHISLQKLNCESSTSQKKKRKTGKSAKAAAKQTGKPVKVTRKRKLCDISSNTTSIKSVVPSKKKRKSKSKLVGRRRRLPSISSDEEMPNLENRDTKTSFWNSSNMSNDNDDAILMTCNMLLPPSSKIHSARLRSQCELTSNNSRGDVCVSRSSLVGANLNRCELNLSDHQSPRGIENKSPKRFDTNEQPAELREAIIECAPLCENNCCNRKSKDDTIEEESMPSYDVTSFIDNQFSTIKSDLEVPVGMETTIGEDSSSENDEKFSERSKDCGVDISMMSVDVTIGLDNLRDKPTNDQQSQEGETTESCSSHEESQSDEDENRTEDKEDISKATIAPTNDVTKENNAFSDGTNKANFLNSENEINSLGKRASRDVAYPPVESGDTPRDFEVLKEQTSSAKYLLANIVSDHHKPEKNNTDVMKVVEENLTENTSSLPVTIPSSDKPSFRRYKPRKNIPHLPNQVVQTESHLIRSKSYWVHNQPSEVGIVPYRAPLTLGNPPINQCPLGLTTINNPNHMNGNTPRNNFYPHSHAGHHTFNHSNVLLEAAPSAFQTPNSTYNMFPVHHSSANMIRSQAQMFNPNIQQQQHVRPPTMMNRMRFPRHFEGPKPFKPPIGWNSLVYHGIMELKLFEPDFSNLLNNVSIGKDKINCPFTSRHLPYIQSDRPGQNLHQRMTYPSSDGITKGMLIRFRDVALSLRAKPSNVVADALRIGLRITPPNPWTDRIYNTIYNPNLLSNSVLLNSLGYNDPTNRSVINEDYMIEVDDFFNTILPHIDIIMSLPFPYAKADMSRKLRFVQAYYWSLFRVDITNLLSRYVSFTVCNITPNIEPYTVKLFFNYYLSNISLIQSDKPIPGLSFGADAHPSLSLKPLKDRKEVENAAVSVKDFQPLSAKQLVHDMSQNNFPCLTTQLNSNNLNKGMRAFPANSPAPFLPSQGDKTPQLIKLLRTGPPTSSASNHVTSSNLVKPATRAEMLSRGQMNPQLDSQSRVHSARSSSSTVDLHSRSQRLDDRPQTIASNVSNITTEASSVDHKGQTSHTQPQNTALPNISHVLPQHNTLPDARHPPVVRNEHAANVSTETSIANNNPEKGHMTIGAKFILDISMETTNKNSGQADISTNLKQFFTCS